MRAEDAQPGDVVLRQEDGQVYQAPYGGALGWSRMTIIGYLGDPRRTAPAGDLTLLARDGRPAS